MGARGPKRQPEALKVFKGTRFKHGSTAKATPLGSVPAPPDTLGDRGREIWIKQAPLAVAMGLLAAADLEAFLCYCEAWDEHQQATDLVKLHGLIVESAKGTLMANPAVNVRNRAIDKIRRFGAEFGFTPSSRASLNVAPQKEEDDIEEFKVG